MNPPLPADLVDLERYPVLDHAAPSRAEFMAALRSQLAQRGAAILPGFLRPDGAARINREIDLLLARAHREDTWGTPYLELPDESWPDGHPRRTAVRSVTWVMAYDLMPLTSAARALYEWSPLMEFIAAVLGRKRIHRYADPMGALNLTSMVTDDVQGWHYDATDFVVSIGLQSGESGGEFECAPFLRADGDEHYDDVARILAGRGDDKVGVFPIVPGTMMIFAGRDSLHRVSPVRGSTERRIMLLGYDTKPGTTSSDLLKLVRYGRLESFEPPADWPELRERW